MPIREPSDASQLALGIDLGATKVISGLVAPDGTVVRLSGRHLHANDGPGGVIRTLVRSARSVLDELHEQPSSIGLAVAAQVDGRTGTVVHAPNLRWRDVPLADRVAQELGQPVRVINDARASTWAEWKLGSGRGVQDFFCLILGTGIGGSAIVGGRLAEGASNALGEVGHLTVVSGGRRCHCPNFGCLEAYAGGWAIAERARELVATDSNAGISLLQRGSTEPDLTAQDVIAAARQGDALASRLVSETERLLADGIVGIVNAFNPAVLAIGGGLAAGLPRIVPIAEAAVRGRCQPPAANARLVSAQFGEHAPLVGAAEYARSAVPHGKARSLGA